jgi:hypothetical protein
LSRMDRKLREECRESWIMQPGRQVGNERIAARAARGGSTTAL